MKVAIVALAVILCVQMASCRQLTKRSCSEDQKYDKAFYCMGMSESSGVTDMCDKMRLMFNCMEEQLAECGSDAREENPQDYARFEEMCGAI